MTERRSLATFAASYRRSIEPDADRLAALWKEIDDDARAPRILPTPAPPPRRWTRRSLALVTLAAAAAIILAVWLGPMRTATRGDARAPDLAEHSSVHPEPAGGSAVRSDAPAPGERPTTGEALDSRVDPGDESPPSTRVRPSPRERRPAPEPAPEPDPEPSSAASESTTGSLAEETALIREAEARLRDGDPESAIESLARHARRFPRGALTIERRALQAIAWCNAGDLEGGREEAAHLRPHVASRPYRDRIERACQL